MTFHFKETHTSTIMNLTRDSPSCTPELKFCAVKVEKTSWFDFSFINYNRIELVLNFS